MQKMRMLFALFITLPLILSLSLEPGYAETNKIENIMGEVFEKLKSFNSKTDEEKDKMIKELDSSILDLNKEIKNYISEKKEKPYGKIIDLMRKMHVMNHYLKNRVCNQGDENCSNEKKRLMNNIIAVLEDNFKECPVTIEYINKLSSDTYANLSLHILLIQSIIENKDFMEKSQRKVISSLLGCIGDQMNDYWPGVVAKYGKDGDPDSIKFLKEDLSKTLLKEIFKLYEDSSSSSVSESSSNLLLEKERERERLREKVFGEIIDILKEIKESKKDKTLIIIISCLATITILIGGFLLYRFIRRKNSNLIETTKDLVASENKVSK
jgi:hypothetical protein